MKNKILAIVLGVGIIAITVAILLWRLSVASNRSLTNKRFVPIPEVLGEGGDFATVLEGLEKNGNLPATVGAGDVGKSNPFN
ncbi:MAG TPA: hypothetical protein PLX55_00680 [bacterium]|nr:hypothetical protein [bacterium]HOR57533.1 hypothetical protein [bacterium]HPL56269.1 hypothetical protein [bacterium]HPM27666.1 hypothetical protein [bacterium]